jgi:hypothetical protein
MSLSLLFLLVGLLIVWFAKAAMAFEGDAVYVALLVIPFAAYAVLSGRVAEVKGPGGWEARFAEVATATVDPSSETLPVEELQVVAKMGTDALSMMQERIDESEPIVMTMRVGGTRYSPRAVRLYLDTLSHFPNFKFVVFLDGWDRVLGYMPQWALKALLADPQLGRRFLGDLTAGRVKSLLMFPGIVRKTISENEPNSRALQEMEEQNLEALVVTDETRLLKGVVEREQVLSRMMLALTR